MAPGRTRSIAGPARVAAGGLALLAACSSEPVSPPPPPPPPPAAASCSGQPVLQLAVGAHQVLDATQNDGCARVPTAGGSGAEYLVVIAAGAGNRSTSGISAGYQLRASTAAAAVVGQAPAAAVAAAEPPGRTPSAQESFDLMLRQREQELSRDPAAHLVAPAAAPIALAPPVVGDVRTFKTCNNLSCTGFSDVTATARYVGTKAAIYMDNSVPTNDTLLAADYADLGQTFDQYHYPIDSAAFGTESDLDNNQRIVILMTDAVNSLTPDCTNGRILGYFFGLDLITTGTQSANSNKGEVFYTFVPSPANATGTCKEVSRSTALNNIKPTLIHELQHMISWNRRVTVGGGTSEETWLNEAMSHYAEELGGRLIPNSECPNPPFSSCRSQYASSNIINAHDYLSDSENHFMVYPTSSSGTLEERGASWLFLRWVVDQFATDTIVGGDFTPGMVTGGGGAATFTARTGVPFATLVTEWLMASYLDDQVGFTGLSDRLRFKSWGLRAVWTNPANSQIFPSGFPIKPDSTSGGYSRTGTLRGGSGGYLRLIQAANGGGIDVQLVGSGGSVIDPAIVPRIGVVRVR